jgi:gas vesicle protein
MEASMSCGKKESGGGFKALLFGMLVGLVLGVIFAPKPGSETLSDVSEKVSRKMPA